MTLGFDKQEQIWFNLLRTLYAMKSKAEQSPAVKNRQDLKEDFQRFYQMRINVFIQQMSTKVVLDKVIMGLVDLNPTLGYQEIQAPFESIITDKFYQTNVTKTASEVSRKAYIDIHSDFVTQNSGGLGVNYNYEVCGLCLRYYGSGRESSNDGLFQNLKIDNTSIVAFQCRHHFHEKCLKAFSQNPEEACLSSRSTNSSLSASSAEGFEPGQCPTCVMKISPEDILPGKRKLGK